jgi:hypothetical protein
MTTCIRGIDLMFYNQLTHSYSSKSMYRKTLGGGYCFQVSLNSNGIVDVVRVEEQFCTWNVAIFIENSGST